MDGFFVFLRVAFALLGLVCLLILFLRKAGKTGDAFLFLKKLGMKSGTDTHFLKRIDTMSVGYKKYIVAVEAGSYVLVVGVGEKEITPLARIERNEVPR
jgi:flagellar biogenesis protein FliO